MTSIEPGWYRDPADPATQRYWDGEGWLGDPIPADAQPPETPPPPYQPPDPLGGRATPTGQTPTGQTPTGQTPGGQTPGGQTGERPAPEQPWPGQPPTSGQPWPGQPPISGQPWPGQPPGPWPAGTPPYAVLRWPIPAPRPHGMPLATLSARFVARLIDILAILGLNVVVNSWFVAQYLREISPILREVQRRLIADESLAAIEVPSRLSWLQIAILGIAMALWLAYEVPSIASTGQTLGKRIMRIRVVRVESQEPVGIRRALRRWNPLGMPVMLWGCYGLGALLQLADIAIGVFDRPLHQTLHDRSAGTVVVGVVQPPPAGPADQGSPATPQESTSQPPAGRRQPARDEEQQ